MNLKLVVASMSILGLVSCPVVAAHAKHKMKHRPVAEQDYKDMGSFKDGALVCTIPQPALVMVGMTQNVGRSLPNPCNPGWFNRLQFSGGINVDLGKFGNRNAGYMGENYQHVSLNDAYLNVAANITDWAKAFASFSYNTATVNPIGGIGSPAVAEYSAAYSNNANGSLGSSTVQLEQGFAVFSNFDQSPLFLQVGKSFVDFSRYEIHPITRSMTQVMSETLATNIAGGFILPMGFHGSIYAFDTPINQLGKSASEANYGGALGYDQVNDQLGFDVGVGYLWNMMGANDVAYAVNQFNVISTGAAGFSHRASAGAVYADVNSGPFTIGARYTVALQRFSNVDLPKNFMVLPTSQGAKPWAAGIQAGFGFDGWWGRSQNIYLGYQTSREAAALLLPKSRWLVGYGIQAFGQNTDIGIEWDHDMDYNTSNGGNGNNTNLVSLRTSVKFG